MKIKKLIYPILFLALVNCSKSDEIIEEIITVGVENKIIVTRNASNYNSIRKTIENIKDASESKQYIVFVPNGIWRETDLQGKKYVKLVGESLDNTILICDPLGSMANLKSPANYSFPDSANKLLSEIEQSKRHLFNITSDTQVENLTVSAINCKYPIHIDDVTFKKVIFKNCRIKEEICNQVVGIGTHNGQNIQFENCILESVSSAVDRMAVFLHNGANTSEGNVISFNNCEFKNATYLIIDELGSGQKEEINLINCSTNVNKNLILMVDKDSDGKTFWTNPATGIKEPNPVNVPYNFRLNVTGTKIDNIYSYDSGNFSPAWNGIPQRNILTFKENVIGLK